MKNNDIKNQWKSMADNRIKNYSESELNDMVIKSARKSIRAVYPGNVFRLIIIGVIIFISTKLVIYDQSQGKIMIDLCGLIILSVSYFLWERSAYIMRRYSSNIPVKQWLEERIKLIEKSTRFNIKYDWALYGAALLIAIVFYVSYQLVLHIQPNIINVVVIPVGIAIYFLIVRHFLNKNYRNTLKNLKDLYKQFEE